jgi:polar amino acid transport system substrate-binding protein
MNRSRFRILGVIAAAAIVAGACTSAGATASPTATAVPPTATPASAAPGSPTMAPLPTVPATDLIAAGKLTICSDTAYPPQESLDSNQKPVGSDIDLSTEIAKRLGLTLVVKSIAFNVIIPALTGGGCDIIVSAQTITAERQQQVDMIPYFQAGQEFVVLAGNPEHIATVDDLCGKSVAAEDGTVEAMHISGTGDYKPADGLSNQCVAKGKAKITLKTFTLDTQALLALSAGTVSAHFTDEPVAGYEVAHGNGAYEVVPNLNLERAPEGISVGKNHTGLRDAVRAALDSMIADGTYLRILTTWGIQSGAVTSTAPVS